MAEHADSGRAPDPAGAAFQRIAEELLARTGASRVTIRLDTPGAVFPIVAEARAEGIRSLVGDTSIDLRGAATFRFLESRLEPLVQEDCTAGEFPAPPELVELYGVKAQMLGPVVREGSLAGIVSVHHAPSTRAWSDEDRAALDEATARVASELSKGASP